MSRNIEEVREWQIKAIQIGRTAKNFLCQAPGGSGKSLVQVILAQADIEACGNKQLILVPQNHIHHTFVDEDEITFRIPASDQVSHWRVDLNLCLNADCKRLKRWLLSDPAPGRLAAISSHRAMVLVWQKLNKGEKRRALRRITFRIDEAHHLSHVFHDADLELYHVRDQQTILDDATALGNVVNYILRVNDPTVKLHLTTATFFRGDNKTILSKAFRREFAHYSLPWDEHFETLGISDLRFDFITYDGDPINLVLEAIRQEPNEHHLIIIPSLTRRFRTKETISRIMSGLLKLFPKTEILDQVTQKTQAAHKALLMKQPKTFKVVVACRLFDEGTDWVPCNRMHNTDAGEDSVTLAVQRFFRPLRMDKDKRNVTIVNYVRTFSPELEREEQREILSDRFNTLLACIVTQGELVPTFIKLKKPTTEGRNRKRLQELYGDDYPILLEDLLKGYERLPEKTSEAVEELAEKLLKEYGCPDEVERDDVLAALCAQAVRFVPKPSESNRRTLAPTSIDADEIRKRGFDHLWPKSGRRSAMCWGSDKVDVAVIRDLMAIVKPVPSLAEIHTAIHSYAKRTGQRPSVTHCLWCDELNRSFPALDSLLRRYYGTALGVEVIKVLGGRYDGLVEQTHQLIRDYWDRGLILNCDSGIVPALGITAGSLDERLREHFNTSLAQEREQVLDRETLLPLDKVKDVLRKYIQQGEQVTYDTKNIPELRISGASLDRRLRSWYETTLSEVVTKLAGEMGVTFSRKVRNPETVMPLDKVKDVLRKYIQEGKQITAATEDIPELGIAGWCLDQRLRSWYAITLPELVHQLAEEMGATLSRKERNPEAVMPLDKVKAVIGEYAHRNVRITAATEDIPELGITGWCLDQRLRSWYRTTLPELVDQVATEMNLKFTRQAWNDSQLSLDQIRKVVRGYSTRGVMITKVYGFIPELRITSGTLYKRLRKEGLTFADIR